MFAQYFIQQKFKKYYTQTNCFWIFFNLVISFDDKMDTALNKNDSLCEVDCSDQKP